MSGALRALHARYDHDVTFCVHVHNRLSQLQATLPENLERVRAAPRAGIVLLNYNSQDGVHEWVNASHREDIARGKLIYVRESRAQFFHASKSKNLAHRLAPGRLLVNLDGDNFIGNSLPFLLGLAASSNRLLVHMWSGIWKDGTYGRIAVSRKLFHQLGGYDESLLPIGFQDSDLIMRARLANADVLAIEGQGFRAASGLSVRAIANTKTDSLRFTGSKLSFELMNRLNKLRSRYNRLRHGPRANPGGWGRADVEVNFETELALG